MPFNASIAVYKRKICYCCCDFFLLRTLSQSQVKLTVQTVHMAYRYLNLNTGKKNNTVKQKEYTSTAELLYLAKNAELVPLQRELVRTVMLTHSVSACLLMD